MEGTQNLPPVRKEKEIELMRMELELLGKVVSDPDLKTQVTQTERVILTLLSEISTNPFRISEKISKTKNIPFDMRRYESKMLQSFVLEYMRKGKALDRKGIKEDVDIMTSYCQMQTERNSEKNKVQSPLTK